MKIMIALVVVYKDAIMRYDTLRELKKWQPLTEPWRLATREEIDQWIEGP